MKNVTSIIVGSILAVTASTISAAPEVLEHVDMFSSPTEQPADGIGGSLDFAFQGDDLGLSTDGYSSEVELNYTWNRGSVSYKPWVSFERTSVDEIDTDVVALGFETTFYGENRLVVLETSWDKEEDQHSLTLELTHNSDVVTGLTLGQHVAYEDKRDEGTETTLRTGAVWSVSDDFRVVGSVGAILEDSNVIEATTRDLIVALEHDLGSSATVGVGGRWAQTDFDDKSTDLQAWEVRLDFFQQENVTPYVSFINESVDGVEEQVAYAGLKFTF